MKKQEIGITVTKEDSECYLPIKSYYLPTKAHQSRPVDARSKSRLFVCCIYDIYRSSNRSDPVLDMFDMFEFLPIEERFFRALFSREIIQSSKQTKRKKYHFV